MNNIKSFNVNDVDIKHINADMNNAGLMSNADYILLHSLHEGKIPEVIIDLADVRQNITDISTKLQRNVDKLATVNNNLISNIQLANTNKNDIAEINNKLATVDVESINIKLEELESEHTDINSSITKIKADVLSNSNYIEYLEGDVIAKCQANITTINENLDSLNGWCTNVDNNIKITSTSVNDITRTVSNIHTQFGRINTQLTTLETNFVDVDASVYDISVKYKNLCNNLQTQINKINTSVGIANGIATLDSAGKLTQSQIPEIEVKLPDDISCNQLTANYVNVNAYIDANSIYVRTISKIIGASGGPGIQITDNVSINASLSVKNEINTSSLRTNHIYDAIYGHIGILDTMCIETNSIDGFFIKRNNSNYIYIDENGVNIDALLNVHQINISELINGFNANNTILSANVNNVIFESYPVQFNKPITTSKILFDANNDLTIATKTNISCVTITSEGLNLENKQLNFNVDGDTIELKAVYKNSTLRLIASAFGEEKVLAEF